MWVWLKTAPKIKSPVMKYHQKFPHAFLQLHGQRESVSHGEHAQGDPGVSVQLLVQLVDGHGVEVVGGGV